MKIENQYKSEGELYLLFNLLRNPGPHTASFLAHLMPLGWDNERVLRNVLALAEESNLKLSNFYFNQLMFETTFPESYERTTKKIKEKPEDKDSKLQKRFFENKFSLSDIEEELKGSFEKAIDYILGGQESVLEALSFDIDVPSAAKTKIEKMLRDYVEKFIQGDLRSNKKNFYTFARHKDIFLIILKKLHGDHGNEFVISGAEFDDEKFLLIHCLLAFEQLGYLNLGSLRVSEDRWQNEKDGRYEAQVSLRPSVIEELNKIETAPSEKTGKKESKITALYLNGIGDLWREPKDKFCYPMGETSDRHKIVRYLVTNKGYQQTTQISLALGEKSKQTIRQEKRKINENFRKFLKIKTDDLIEGRQGSGYRINPSYKISLKDG